jgi:hypothetical protein
VVDLVSIEGEEDFEASAEKPPPRKSRPAIFETDVRADDVVVVDG